jgi:hypothetical protein
VALVPRSTRGPEPQQRVGRSVGMASFRSGRHEDSATPPGCQGMKIRAFASHERSAAALEPTPRRARRARAAAP